MITYQREGIDACLEEMFPLLDKHYREIAWRKDDIPLDVDYGKYKALDAAGHLHIATAREDGKLIGYCVTIAHQHPHYNSTTYALNDVIYIEPEYRKTGAGYKLLAFVEQEMKEADVDVYVMHMKTYAPFRELMEARGYDEVEINYSKWLGD